MIINEPENYPTVSQLDDVVADLMLQELMAFTPENEIKVPGSHGLYAIHTRSGVSLHAGRTKTRTLRNRLYAQHYRGGGKSADSDLVQKIQSQSPERDKRAAQAWIAENCVFRWIEVPNPILRHWAEHRLLSALRPIWCVPKGDLQKAPA